jgi:hypothetical protein
MGVESAADRAYLLRTADFGVVVVIGSTTTVGLVDLVTDPMLMGAVVGQNASKRSVLVRTSDIGSLVIGGAITVDGTVYVANDIQMEPPDGAFTRVWLHD